MLYNPKCVACKNSRWVLQAPLSLVGGGSKIGGSGGGVPAAAVHVVVVGRCTQANYTEYSQRTVECFDSETVRKSHP